MKLDRRTFSVLGLALGLVLALSGCHRHDGRNAATPVSTTQLTSAEVGEANAPTPRTGKTQQAAALDPEQDGKRSDRGTRKRGGVFGNWK
jgi:hypothetical protein